VFLRWLLTTFPHEMRLGWAMLRPDLLLWLAFACLIVLATMSIPLSGDDPLPLVPFLIFAVTRLVTAMLPAILFTAQLEGRQLSWGPVLLLMARRALPVLVYATIANVLAELAERAMAASLGQALGPGAPSTVLATMAGVIIYVSVLVHFSFLPFLVILLDRPRLPPALWQWNRLQAVAPVFWPLTASSRMTEGFRWRLAFYMLLGRVVPSAAMLVPPTVLLPALVLALLLLMTVQAVFFLHYRTRCEETGVPAPALPLEPALAI
jgi:hypothetical protein